MDEKPLVSVIMSVYNADKYLKRSIDSILNQTLSDFEFIIINDASIDSSLSIINSYNDDRIKLINKPFNKGFIGFVENLNLGIEIAKGKYISRMDADDISRLDRFEIQYNFLESNPEIFMVGSDLNLINNSGQKIGYLKSPTNHNDIIRKFNSENAMYHPVIFFRNELNIRYRDKFKACEDFDFYLQLLSQGKKFSNINQPLLDYRMLEDSISRSGSGFSKRLLMEISKDFFVSRLKDNKDNYTQLNYDLFERIENNSNVTTKELKEGLKVALMYNSTFYYSIYQKLLKRNQTNISDKLYLNKSFKKLYSKIKLKYNSKFGKISSNL